MCAQSLRPVQLFVTSWAIAHQAALSIGFPRQEYQSGLSFSPPGDLPDPGINPSPALQADSLLLHRWGSCGMQQKQSCSTLLGFSQQGHWGCLPFPPPVDSVLSELSTMTCPSWAAPVAWLRASVSYASPFTQGSDQCTLRKA